MKKQVIIWLLITVPACANWANYIDPDDIKAAQVALHEKINKVAKDKHLSVNDKAWQLLSLGAWEREDSLWKANPKADLRMSRAKLAYLSNKFEIAEKLVMERLKENDADPYARELRVELLIQRWNLDIAEQQCNEWIKSGETESLAFLLGKIYLLKKEYEKAMDQARHLEKKFSRSGKGYLLESEVHFWNQHPERTEEPLKESLKRDPFNADARFDYGYSIWRRRDATQLDAMAAQWSLALDIHPLHYLTHWHWGNGHTNLTYADYAEPDDDSVRLLLQKGDSLIAEDSLKAAIKYTYKVQVSYPHSVLPRMMRGSIFYIKGEGGHDQWLDSAQYTFLQILKLKHHYGPAHNGLAAVIKAKRFPYLTQYDSLEQQVENMVIKNKQSFERVFPDTRYYPGDRVAKMVYGELHASTAYIPMLEKLGRTFAIPPLHRDLTDAMHSPYFRGGTTFDNRQWMDIRGVGSGATGIEYVERGAHLERNVTLHEYTHLYHGLLFSDHEKRRVRALYYHAKQNHLTLDYYSANNESEYLAQTYTAYFAWVKVHPLNHKSMNTRNELVRKDPQLFAFLDSLVKRQNAYLTGDTSALSENWAETYLQLAAQETRQKRYIRAGRYIDSAFLWNSRYVPAFLAKARNEAHQGRYNTIEGWLKVANMLHPDYGPVSACRAAIARIRFENGDTTYQKSIGERIQYMKDALAREKDLSMREEYSRRIRRLYEENGHRAEAVNAAQRYIDSAPVLSTYLEDRKEQAVMYRDWAMGSLGYNDRLKEMQQLVEANPQNYYYRQLFGESLLQLGKYDRAIKSVNQAQSILRAAGNPRESFEILLAEGYAALKDTTEAEKHLEEVLKREKIQDRAAVIRLLAKIGRRDEAVDLFSSLVKDRIPVELADYYFTQAAVATDSLEKSDLLKKCLENNPYYLKARTELIGLLSRTSRKEEANRLITEAKSMLLPPAKAILEAWEAQ